MALKTRAKLGLAGIAASVIALSVVWLMVFVPSQTQAQTQTKTSGNDDQATALTTSASGVEYHPAAISLADNQTLHVYYFHGNVRCTTCKKIEKYTVEGVQQGYAKEIGAGQVKLHLVNVELPENEHFISDFELITRTVVLATEEGGQLVSWRRLDDVWSAVISEQKFMDYLYGQIGAIAPSTKG